MILDKIEREKLDNKNLSDFLELINLDEDLKILNNKLINIINDYDNISTKDLVKYLETDGMLVSKILRLINSPYWGMVEPIKSIKQAVVLLGRVEIKNIILMTAYLNQAESMNFNKATIKKFLLQSYISGDVIRTILKKYDDVIIFSADEGFILGLLHNLGKLFIYKYIPDIAKTIQNFWETIETKPFINYLGFSHIDVSKFILNKIGFEQIINFSENSEDLIIDKIVFLADVISLNVTNREFDITKYIDKNSNFIVNETIEIQNEYINEIISSYDSEKLNTLF